MAQKNKFCRFMFENESTYKLWQFLRHKPCFPNLRILKFLVFYACYQNSLPIQWKILCFLWHTQYRWWQRSVLELFGKHIILRTSFAIIWKLQRNWNLFLAYVDGLLNGWKEGPVLKLGVTNRCDKKASISPMSNQDIRSILYKSRGTFSVFSRNLGVFAVWSRNLSVFDS